MVCILKLASKVHCVYNYKQDTNIMLFININVFVVHLRSHMINSISAFVGFTDLNFFFFLTLIYLEALLRIPFS